MYYKWFEGFYLYLSHTSTVFEPAYLCLNPDNILSIRYHDLFSSRG